MNSSGPTVKNMCDSPKEKNQHQRWNAPTNQFNLKVVADRWEQGWPTQQVGDEGEQGVRRERGGSKPRQVPAMVLNRHHPPHIEEESERLNAACFVSIDGFNGHFRHPETVS